MDQRKQYLRNRSLLPRLPAGRHMGSPLSRRAGESVAPAQRSLARACLAIQLQLQGLPSLICGLPRRQRADFEPLLVLPAQCQEHDQAVTRVPTGEASDDASPTVSRIFSMQGYRCTCINGACACW